MKIDAVRKLSPFDRLVYWIKERESIRLKKEAGEPPPWTDDTILQSYRFTCPRRMDDKVSRWLLKNWYSPKKDHPNILPAVCLARTFNQPSTLEIVSDLVWSREPDWDLVAETIKGINGPGPVFNAAYIVSTSGIRANKVDHVVQRYVRPMYENPPEVHPDSMRETVISLSSRYGYSSFMAGQVTADLRWAVTGKWSDRHTWAPAGPGSRRGMNRLDGLPPESPIKPGVFSEKLVDLITRTRPLVPDSLKKRMEAIDYQSCLCEFDKYERVLWGQGRPKQGYRAR